jgi:hypothetical protein
MGHPGQANAMERGRLAFERRNSEGEIFRRAVPGLQKLRTAQLEFGRMRVEACGPVDARLNRKLWTPRLRCGRYIGGHAHATRLRGHEGGQRFATDLLLDGNPGAAFTRLRQALDPLINYRTNRLEEFNPRIRQVLSYRGRNLKAFV